MQAIKRKNPLTESFLVQLDVDLEGAGIENTQDLRTNAQPPKPYATRSEACPSEHLVMGHQTTYGDLGAGGGAYNDPNTTSNMTSTAPSQPSVPSSFGYTDLSNMADEHHMGFMASSQHQFELPNRQRSPASGPSSGMHRSPQEMDVSPGASTGEHRTPNSSSHQSASAQGLSAHTSHTGYSPQSLQPETTPGRLTGPALFNPNDAAFSTDFDMHSFPASAADSQQQGFVLPSNWGSGGTGMTPGPTGFTPGASGMSDMINMSDEAWNQMMDSMGFSQEWETGVVHSNDMGTLLNNRRM
jgi:hypothetical protein